MIDATNAADVRFSHADGSRYGEPLSVEAVDVHAKVFKALCKLGFGEREVRRVLAALRGEPEAGQVTAEGLLREAVGRLTSSR